MFTIKIKVVLITRKEGRPYYKINIGWYYLYCIDPIVRDNSAEALGTAWKVVSEKNIVSFLTSVDAIKLSKVT